VKVTILGSGTCIPHPQRASPGLAVEVGEATALLDPSAGTLHRMAQRCLSLDRLRWVAFSHFHPDHTGDLVPLLFALRNSQDSPPRPLTLIGPPGLGELHRALEGVYGHWVRLPDGVLSIVEIQDEELSLEGWRLRAAPVEHADPSVGLRLTDRDGGVVVYSGDSDYCANLVELARGADLAVLEASYPGSSRMAGHLTPQLAGRVAREAGVSRLVLTHMYPACDGHDLLSEVRLSGFAGQAEVAYDGQRLEVRPSGSYQASP
jgi:ribonuclease BN (tRNA processing enzyme)